MRGPTFDEFWERVPQKQDKPEAKAAWAKMKAEDRQAAFDAVQDWYAAERRARPDGTLLYPVRYLKRRRWEDEGWQPKATAPPIEDRAEHFGAMAREGKHLSPFVVTSSLAQEIIGRGIATKDQLRNAGISV